MYREVGTFRFDVQRFAGANIQFRRFVVDKEARDYFEPSSKIWLEKLTAYEKSAVTQYTGKAYEKINSYLRGELANIELKPVLLTELENKINAIESALSKFELQDNIILYRQCDEEFLQTLRTSKFGLFHENGFWSTTAVEGSVNRGSVHIEIFFSAGTGAGAWIKPLSLNPNDK